MGIESSSDSRMEGEAFMQTRGNFPVLPMRTIQEVKFLKHFHQRHQPRREQENLTKPSENLRGEFARILEFDRNIPGLQKAMKTKVHV